MPSRVTAVPPAAPEIAAAHFRALLELETDCFDVNDALASGSPDFVLLDVRAPTLYAKGHVRGAINMPHATISEEALRGHRRDALFVVYCAGPHCNGAHRAAIRLATLGRRVKIMIGGVAGWIDEGLALE